MQGGDAGDKELAAAARNGEGMRTEVRETVLGFGEVEVTRCRSLQYTHRPRFGMQRFI
jgi:hypothetical protein